MRSYVVGALFGAFLLGSSCAQAAPSSDMFYLTTQKIRRANDLPQPATYAAPGIDGVFVRIGWSTIEPQRGQFDWTLFDQVATRAVAAGKVLSIGILAGEDTPEWLAQAGVPFTTMTISQRGCREVSVPTPWDPDYVTNYVRMMAAVKDRLVQLKAYQAVKIVKLTAIAQHTLELRLPRNNPCSSTVDDQWAKLGYRPSKIVGAWDQIAAGVSALYPSALMVQPILQAQGFPAVDEDGRAVARGAVHTGDAIIARCIARFKARCGVQWNALKLAGPMAPRVTDAHRAGATIGWQTNLYEGPRVGVGCQIDRRAATKPCTEPEYGALLRRGIDLGGSFIEVWEPDVAKFPAAFAAARKRS